MKHSAFNLWNSILDPLKVTKCLISYLFYCPVTRNHQITSVVETFIQNHNSCLVPRRHIQMTRKQPGFTNSANAVTDCIIKSRSTVRQN